MIFFFSVDIDRSIIRLPNRTSQTPENRSSTSAVLHIRTVDIQSSIEYRELEKKNKQLSAQVDNLKQVVKKMRKEKKIFEETHMYKLFINHFRLD